MLPPRFPGETRLYIPSANVTMLEKHFSLGELAEKWGYSHSFVLRCFRDEPGVIAPQLGMRARRRTKNVYRVPASVAQRVYESMRIGVRQ